MMMNEGQGTVTLSPLFGEGGVLQSGAPLSIWGTGRPCSRVRVTIADQSSDAVVKDDGDWAVRLGPLEPGGPYRLEMRVDGDAEPVIAHDVYVGEVFVCAGQSNMEYQMEFLRWRYPSEFTREPDPLLRHCKVPVRFDFHGPRRDFDEPVRWVGAAPDTLDEFTGVGYFFGRMIRQWLDVPVGLLNITLGGSPIESWMDEQTLAAWPKALADLEPYRDDAEAQRRIDASLAAIRDWYGALDLPRTDAAALAAWGAGPAAGRDAGGRGSDTQVADAQVAGARGAGVGDCGAAGRDAGDADAPACGLEWRPITLPAFLNDAPDPALHGLRGSVYLHRTLTLPAYHAGAPAALHLGAMVDADVTWVNGVEVGRSEHQYLSRDYMVPRGVLRAGRNDIVVRLVSEHGAGRVTPGKRMRLDIGDDSYELSGAWSYAVGATAPCDCPGEDFVRWKPLGLYNGMTATCAGYGARAVLWYQGESNTGDAADDYGRMLRAMVGCWRAAWGQDRLPFLVVQLPGFSIDGVEDGGWPLVRRHQWLAQREVDDLATAVTLDAGDWNDLHPWNKRLVAERLFDAARRLVYGEADAPRPPEPTDVRLADGRLVIRFDDGTGAPGLCTMDGADPGEFALVWEDGSVSPVPARVDGDTVAIAVPWRRPASVRYAWRNAPDRGLLCGANGLPVPPFALPIPAA